MLNWQIKFPVAGIEMSAEFYIPIFTVVKAAIVALTLKVIKKGAVVPILIICLLL